MQNLAAKHTTWKWVLFYEIELRLRAIALPNQACDACVVRGELGTWKENLCHSSQWIMICTHEIKSVYLSARYVVCYPSKRGRRTIWVTGSEPRLAWEDRREKKTEDDEESNIAGPRVGKRHFVWFPARLQPSWHMNPLKMKVYQWLSAAAVLLAVVHLSSAEEDWRRRRNVTSLDPESGRDTLCDFQRGYSHPDVGLSTA